MGQCPPTTEIAITGTRITFVSPKEEEDSKADMIFEGALKSQSLSGTVNGPDGMTGGGWA